MAEYICKVCGWEGERKRRLRGSKTVEILIWTTIMIPGPLYSIWRRTGVQKECPNCHLPMLVKTSNPEGQLARRKFDIEMGILPTPKKQEPKPDALAAFGNDKPAETPKKKPVNPDEW